MIGWLAITVSVALGARVAVRRLVPPAERDQVPPMAAPLVPALGAAFGILMALTVTSEAGYLETAQETVSARSGSCVPAGLGGDDTWHPGRPKSITPLHDYLEATSSSGMGRRR